MTAKKLTVGSTVEAWCTKCKEDRSHAVEALKPDGTPAKVRCGHCSGSHLYRAPKIAPAGEAAKADKAKGEKPKAAKGEKKADTKASAGKRRGKAEPGLTDSETSRAKPYVMDREYAAGDVIDHGKFGFGRVTALRPGGKMEVHFDGGSRLLVCKDTGSLLLRRSSRAIVRPLPEVEEVEPDEAEAIPAETADAAEE